jgi:hypothetical protein
LKGGEKMKKIIAALTISAVLVAGFFATQAVSDTKTELASGGGVVVNGNDPGGGGA